MLSTYNAQHIFGDLNLAYNQSFVRSVTSKQTELRNSLERAPKDLRATIKQKNISTFKKWLLEQADQLELVMTQPCRTHGCACTVWPELADGTVWIEGNSPSCIHWTSQGKRSKWLGAENISLIMWTIGCRTRCPDLVFIECTKQLQAELEFLRALSGDQLKFFSTVMSPTLIGVPGAGHRVWAVASGNGRLMMRSDPFVDANLVKFIVRRMIGSPEMWLWATPGQVNLYLDHLNTGRDHIPPHPRGKRYRPEDYLNNSSSVRLHMHRLAGAKARDDDPSLIDKHFFYDITQHVNWSQRPGLLLPRPLTSSLLWSEKGERPMTPEEVLSAQGIFAYIRTLAHIPMYQS